MLDIEVKNKSFKQSDSENALSVLTDIEINLNQGEFVALVGPSGCGKSTLLQIIAGLDREFEGTISWQNGTSQHLEKLGYVFQNPRLLPWLTLYDNIALVLDNPAAKQTQISALLEATGLSAFTSYHPAQLSIGMQRRAALARAFVIEPSLLIMDEPFVSLDRPTAVQLRELLLDILAVRRTTVIFVTHDLYEATQLADRILFLSTSPAKVIGETVVGLERDQRSDETVVNRQYDEIREVFTRLYP
ncbi:MAG: ABC transporter ATP-binding protein [Candidatus Thiodiazotropha taylori]|nr:ABC transporter ATP-binding protein [Candidatus Thiodiazotropha taylori]MCG8108101.1 ABC transporter ATP-binding protein [Candidatus Thiodiazotropha taylori]MCG8110129.1 ABC transporter ATP-binding protein [Candidatus Thiodiazotropha taylori]MCW4280440.1 ABC transporter ATP-binding protein [Candidatus Thiodiazotropha taylori]MCW4282475.1 ABC transporter ATP-binding protein [Candidatus Thiodiazotropha taylori]